ncbi:probable helicase with zinc finger domain [Temnothorax curvispinosus]|uniref:Probable helicase with zinc finger domain n=1 Tax=Temnothorax curvispinosus TaxID=300111 RepID=A0A6J1PN77_9HYME|nr:probable helicase with zinc finger domain [Temnothorax curvispinosus]
MAATELTEHESSVSNGNTPNLTDFPERVRYGWFRSNDPDTTLTCEPLPNVNIYLYGSANCRVVGKRGNYEWSFTIFTTGGQELQNVALISDDHRANFFLKSVQDKDGTEIGVTNGQEWHSPCPGNSQENKRQYLVTVGFTAKKHSTYRQDLVFGFLSHPVYLQRICADYLHIKDYERIQKATFYQQSQIPPRWKGPYEFYSPFMPHANPRETKLSRIYPYPDRQNFILTQNTLSDNRLTPRNYRGRMHEMITLEEIARHEQLSRYNQLSWLRLMAHYVLFNSDASTIAKYTPPGELFAQIPLSREILDDTQSGRLLQRSCNSVLLKLWRKKTKCDVFEAHIEDKSSHSVYVRLSKECVTFWDLEAHSEVEVEIQFVLSRLNFCEWHLAVDSLEDMDLVFLMDEHHKTDNEIIRDFLQVDAGNLSILSSLLLDSPLNQEQKQAVTAITLSIKTSSPPVLLLGPFGTGKTFTIAHMLRMLVQNKNNRILLCTHSNSAADLYIKEFFHIWYNQDKHPRLKPVRIYYKLRALNTVHPTVQQYCLMDEHGRFRDPIAADFQDCGLIVTTLATSSCLMSLKLSPTHIVIDEAAQAMECEALIALTLANRETRLLLAGDQMQLAPEIYSVLANERGLGVSLLERMYAYYPPEHPCRIHLCQNYRAHADIIKYTSETFYDGMVKPANMQLLKHPVMKPLIFYAVNGAEEQATCSTGYHHATEAEEVANRVLELRRAWPTQQWGPYNEGSIGVLSYYPEQVQRLRIELRKRLLFDVSVERVLNVQGKQFTAVFISTVRTRISDRSSAEVKIKDYGFLTDPRLLNTALTRAKCFVAVVGDPVALLTIGCCKDLWKKYLDAADLYGMDRKELQTHLNQVSKIQISPLNPHAKEFFPRTPPLCFVQYIQVPIWYPLMYPPQQPM